MSPLQGSDDACFHSVPSFGLRTEIDCEAPASFFLITAEALITTCFQAEAWEQVSCKIHRINPDSSNE